MHSSRLTDLNDAPLRAGGRYVLYWMVASRRLRHNHSLDHALALAAAHSVPVLVFEGLRLDYPWASARHHAFILEGMLDNARDAEEAAIPYFPWVETSDGQGAGLLAALAAAAVAVVTDDWPCFFVPRMQAAAAKALDVRLVAVDGNGLYPMRHTKRAFTVAHSFRRHLQKTLPDLLDDAPVARPTGRGPAQLPQAVVARWPATDLAALRDAVGTLPIDQAVGTVAQRGGRHRALEVLGRFLDQRLDRYDSDRRDVTDEACSGLSPYLHYGHVSSWEVFAALAERESWTPEQLGAVNGKRNGWWNFSEATEGFLDELVTWRELGFNGCLRIADNDTFASLPEWARTTLAAHADDERPHVYDRVTLEEARTHDPIWNAAQRQLRQQGRIHNYLRMLWGKKVLHWMEDPSEAFETLLELNNRWAIDGRDPNSLSGVAWVFGRYDRAWGPERQVFGKVRYMTSQATRRKLDLNQYLDRFGG